MNDLITEIRAGLELSMKVGATETKMGTINYAQIQQYFENIPEQHHKDIEHCIHTRNPELLGQILMMAIWQLIQEEGE